MLKAIFCKIRAHNQRIKSDLATDRATQYERAAQACAYPERTAQLRRIARTFHRHARRYDRRAAIFSAI